MPPAPPIDPAVPGQLVVTGRIVTMDDAGRVLRHGCVYVRDGTIVAVADAGAPAPDGFDAHTPRLDSAGTVYPGLIELHNHLSYNALRLWSVPRTYSNRDQWAGIPTYRQQISGPMQVIGARPDLLPALVRYVEAKCLVAGTTTTQGIALFSAPGIRRYYRGVVRNVEQTAEPALPGAVDRIPDVEATKIDAFERELERQAKHAACLLLHLSEGTDQAARNHFLALEDATGNWAIAPSLAGIHCVGLEDDDIAAFAARGGAMVWSPLSNLLLYGETARIAKLKAAGVRIALGPDWSPSGSKNLLGELKVARLYARHGHTPPLFSDRELVTMVTRTAASILGWQSQLGSIEPGKKADLLTVQGATGNPYTALIGATEREVQLVMVEGIPRYGSAPAMSALGIRGERATIAGARRVLNLAQRSGDPEVASTTLAQATRTLKRALATLPKLAQPRASSSAAAPGPRLALDEIEDTGVQLRPRLPLRAEGAPTGPSPVVLERVEPLPLVPLTLDPLTIPDDPDYLATLRGSANLPSYISSGLARIY